VAWDDLSWTGTGATRTVFELRKGWDHPVARSVMYGGTDPLVWAPDCFHRSAYYKDWFPNSPD
jgi:hypothetical protein